MNLHSRWARLLTPVLYLGFGLIALASIVALIVALDSVGLLLFNGWVELPVLILTAGSLEGWYATKLTCFFEGLRQPKLQDHLRQSLLVYIVTGWLLYQTISLPYYGGLGEAYRLTATVVSLYWMIINAISILLISRL